jgi:hypothetical protein
MFAFHETTRKRICRTAFFALCVAPTLASAAWIGIHRAPGRTGRLARGLSDKLGVHVTLADWREPRPRIVSSSGLVLSDAASGSSLADIASLELRRDGGGHVYSATEVALDGHEMARLSELVRSWLAKLPAERHEIHCRKLIIRLASVSAGPKGAADPLNTIVLYDVKGIADRDASGRLQAQFTARAVEDESSPDNVIRMTLAAATAPESAAPTLTLDTHECSVPAALLAGIVPGFDRLGQHARFIGEVRWSLDAVQIQGVAQGRVDAVELSAVLPAGSPHAIEGSANLELSELSWRGIRIERLAGTVVAGQAQISRSLVEAAVRNFSCGQSGAGVPVASDDALIALDALAVQFELDAKGLTFWGHSPPGLNLPAGCLAMSGSKPLLFGPPYRDWPLGELVRTLAAPSTAWLPATREAVEMADRLPLPLK